MITIIKNFGKKSRLAQRGGFTKLLRLIDLAALPCSRNQKGIQYEGVIRPPNCKSQGPFSERLYYGFKAVIY